MMPGYKNQPTQPSLVVISDAHIQSTVDACRARSHREREEITLSAAAAATLVAAIRLAAFDQGDASRTWAESVDQSSAPSVASWLYARILMTDRYHPTQRGYLPFEYESASEAANAFFSLELRSTYPHLDKSVQQATFDILEELMLISGHLPGDVELAWQRKPTRHAASVSFSTRCLRAGRALVDVTGNLWRFGWFFLLHSSGVRVEQVRAPVPTVKGESLPQEPRPTTPARTTRQALSRRS